jgi:hypothetical protein
MTPPRRHCEYSVGWAHGGGETRWGGTQSELYDAMREHGVAAFTECVLAAHYVLPAPPRSFPVDIQTEIRNNEMAQKEGYWMDTTRGLPDTTRNRRACSWIESHYSLAARIAG